MNFITRKKVVGLFACWCLFFASIVYAATEADQSLQELESAIAANNLVAVKSLLAKGADPRDLRYFPDVKFPSLEISKLLLNNQEKSIEPNTFLAMVLKTPCARPIPGARIDKISNKLSAQQYRLAKLALSYNADPRKIEYFQELPSLKLSQLLLNNHEKSLDINKFLELLIMLQDDGSIKYFAHKQVELFKHIFKNNAVNLDQLKYPELAADWCNQHKKVIINKDQNSLLSNLALILDQFPIAEQFKQSKGYCMGLTTLWLYSMDQQFTQAENPAGYNNIWFNAVTKDIAKFKAGQGLSPEAIKDFLRFSSIIDLFQTHELKNLQQMDVDQRMTLSLLSPHGKTLKKTYSLAAVFTLKQLTTALTEVIHDDELVYVMFPTHATGLFKHGESYYYYDPNHNLGVYRDTSIENIAQAIFTASHKVSLNNAPAVPIGLAIFSFAEQATTYPKQQEFLHRINMALNAENAFEAARQACVVRCTDSIRFFLDQIVDLNITDENGVSLLMHAVDERMADIVSELLKREVNPNQFATIETTFEPGKAEAKQLVTPLNLAVMEGDVEIAKILLADPRTTVDWANATDGKTALMFAAEGGHSEIVKLLINQGADINKQDKNGKTALLLAYEKNNANEALVQLLNPDRCIHGDIKQTSDK